MFPVATFDRSGRYVITGSDDRLVKIWSMETALCLSSCRGHEVSVDGSLCLELYLLEKSRQLFMVESFTFGKIIYCEISNLKYFNAETLDSKLNTFFVTFSLFTFSFGSSPI